VAFRKVSLKQAFSRAKKAVSLHGVFISLDNTMEPPIPSFPVTTDNAIYLTVTLLYEVPADLGKFLWCMANVTAAINSYSKVMIFLIS